MDKKDKLLRYSIQVSYLGILLVDSIQLELLCVLLVSSGHNEFLLLYYMIFKGLTHFKMY